MLGGGKAGGAGGSGGAGGLASRVFGTPPARDRVALFSQLLGAALVAALVVALWRAAAHSSSSAGEMAAQVAALQAQLTSLEARHARAHLEMKQHAQQLMSDQFATVLSGPLLQRHYPPVTVMAPLLRKRILVTGGAGFVGSHLVDALMMQGHYVYVLDNLFTGRHRNIEHWVGHPHFQFFQHDVVQPFYLEVDQIYHLACPASPPHYQYNPIKTIKTSAVGTMNMLGLAKRVKARLLFTSTSEVYGDPEVHPQSESYFGNVNTMGPRACYDEGKRLGETLCYSYSTEEGVETRIARIFNTYGPRMRLDDGRVVSNFIIQTLQGLPVTIYGDGSQTRSFQYVSDLVIGLIKLMASDYGQPVNLGNPDEYTIADFAQKIIGLVNPGTTVTHLASTADDPRQRRPDITRAKKELNWEPRTTIDEGLYFSVKYFREELSVAALGDGVAAAIDKSIKAFTARDASPIWVATVVNEGLTDKEKSLELEKLIVVAAKTE